MLKDITSYIFIILLIRVLYEVFVLKGAREEKLDDLKFKINLLNKQDRKGKEKLLKFQKELSIIKTQTSVYNLECTMLICTLLILLIMEV